LLKDGRKSFRQISRETGISTPTVKARFDRPVNIGFIKSVSPILDFKKVEYGDDLAIDNKLLQATKNKREESENSIKKGIGIRLKCDFCKGPISGKTHVFKFANFSLECRSAYVKKYSGRIEAIIEGQCIKRILSRHVRNCNCAL
jgi:DNA-binding Lrp family transcriptional regulator